LLRDIYEKFFELIPAWPVKMAKVLFWGTAVLPGPLHVLALLPHVVFTQ
jgi:hypothetical protein